MSIVPSAAGTRRSARAFHSGFQRSDGGNSCRRPSSQRVGSGSANTVAEGESGTPIAAACATGSIALPRTAPATTWTASASVSRNASARSARVNTTMRLAGSTARMRANSGTTPSATSPRPRFQPNANSWRPACSAARNARSKAVPRSRSATTRARRFTPNRPRVFSLIGAASGRASGPRNGSFGSRACGFRGSEAHRCRRSASDESSAWPTHDLSASSCATCAHARARDWPRSIAQCRGRTALRARSAAMEFG